MKIVFGSFVYLKCILNDDSIIFQLQLAGFTMELMLNHFRATHLSIVLQKKNLQNEFSVRLVNNFFVQNRDSIAQNPSNVHCVILEVSISNLNRARASYVVLDDAFIETQHIVLIENQLNLENKNGNEIKNEKKNAGLSIEGNKVEGWLKYAHRVHTCTTVLPFSRIIIFYTHGI